MSHPRPAGACSGARGRLEAARHVERAADDNREAGRSSRREGAADHWSSEGKVATCSEPARGVAGVRPPPHMGLLHQRPLSQRSSPHRPTMHADGSLSPHASPKSPQKTGGTHAVVVAVTPKCASLLTYLLSDVMSA